MPVFPVSPAKQTLLEQRMAELDIREDDIDESFVRSSGKGGQHVNKTSTCVQLHHRPTGIIVKCQDERSQALNRYRARVLLVSKIDEIMKGAASEEQQRIAKIRRQKRKQSKRAAAKRMDDKAALGAKKQLRGRVEPSGE